MIEYTPQNIRMWSLLGSCGAFGTAASALPEIDKNILILTADLCYYSGLTRFKETYPDKLINVGIAEQNLIGVAAGLAKEGFNPFVTTYASFASLRCADQVKVNMGYMKLPVKLIGLTSGLSVGILGPTHMCTEDIAVMRSIPNITILSPADCTETVKCVLEAAKINSPVYIRLTGSFNNPAVYKKDYDFHLYSADTIKNGDDITIIATGSMVFNSIKAAQILEKRGLNSTVINMHTLKPLDIEIIKKSCKTKLIVTVEEHSIYGGLGAAVSETLGAINRKPKHLIIGISDEYKHAGEYKYLLEQYELSPEQIAEKIEKSYKET